MVGKHKLSFLLTGENKLRENEGGRVGKSKLCLAEMPEDEVEEKNFEGVRRDGR